MKKMILVCALGVALSGCTVATVQTRSVYSPYPQYPSVYTNPYVYQQPRYYHQPRVYPRCYTTYQRDYYGYPRPRRVCY